MADESDTPCAKCQALYMLSDLRVTVGGKLLCRKCAPSLFPLPTGEQLPLSAPPAAFDYAKLWMVLTFLSAGSTTYYYAFHSIVGAPTLIVFVIVGFLTFIFFGILIGLVILIFRKLIG